MANSENINTEIRQSLENFTRHFAAFASDQLSAMRKCSFFDPVPDELLANLVKVTHMITFKTGDKIIKENDAMGSFYVILFGAASVFAQQNKVGNILRGECLGEGTFFAKDQKRSASVVADGDVIVLEVTKSNIDAIDKETQKYLNKALLLAIFNKLQVANRNISSLTREKEQLPPPLPIDLDLL